MKPEPSPLRNIRLKLMEKAANLLFLKGQVGPIAAGVIGKKRKKSPLFLGED